jgi:GNAT superfamily N-acetyltransferase
MADASAVASLMAELGYPVSPELASAAVGVFTADTGSRLLVADENGSVLGLLAIHLVPRLDQHRTSCRITDIVVEEGHRRRGIGRLLISAAEDHARGAGAPRLDLSSGDWRDAARAFYESLGFETRSRGFTKRVT